MSELLEYIERLGSADEQVPDQDQYKIVYRAMTILLCDNMEYRNEVLDGRLLTRDEAKEELEKAHEYFGLLFQTERGLKLFDMVYAFVLEVNE
tara:strand:- start:66 stop:344 length:279 start_codon:yes stop_codon:yes gene_type:complete